MHPLAGRIHGHCVQWDSRRWQGWTCGTFPPLLLQLVTHSWHQVTQGWQRPLRTPFPSRAAAYKTHSCEPASFASGCRCAGFSHPGRNKSQLFFISVIPPLEIKQKRSAMLYHPVSLLNIEAVLAAGFRALSSWQHAEQLLER